MYWLYIIFGIFFLNIGFFFYRDAVKPIKEKEHMIVIHVFSIFLLGWSLIVGAVFYDMGANNHYKHPDWFQTEIKVSRNPGHGMDTTYSVSLK